MHKVFVDGAEGTTGLKIHEYLKRRDDIDLIYIEESERKDINARLECINEADISFLCLPDDASREIAAKAPSDARILDTSTAHRTDPGWTYGMAELGADVKEAISSSDRVAVPGCHATGAILMIRPLIEEGLIDKEHHFSIFSLTGYSGGGKKMIAHYGSEDMEAPRQYGLTQDHKHLPEIMAMTGLKNKPAFMPVVADYFRGMEVTIPLDGKAVDSPTPKKTIENILEEKYGGAGLVDFVDSIDEEGFISADSLAGTDGLRISVYGNDENILLTAVYDNLGKGASGAAVQNMNIMLGIDEKKGLIL